MARMRGFILRGAALCSLILTSCNTEKPDKPSTSVDDARRKPASSAPGPQPSLEARAPQLNATVSAEPLAAVSLGSSLKASGFALPLNHEVGLSLNLPGVAGWKVANVGTLIARLPDGKIRSLDVPLSGKVTFKTTEPGGAMLVACAGPPVSGRSDAWQWVTHCTKTVLSVGKVKQGAPELDAGITMKLGSPVEIVPFSSPLLLEVGDELPVRVYSLLGPVPESEVIAVRPDKSVDRQIGNRSGVAHFRLTQAGRWLIRFTHRARPVAGEPELERTAELVFEIRGGGR